MEKKKLSNTNNIDPSKIKEITEKRAVELQSSKKRPTVTSVAHDTKTGKLYYGNSGKKTIPKKIHPILAKRIPKPSLEIWPVENCAEFKAVNNALFDGAKIENLKYYTIKVTTLKFRLPCENCMVTLKGATNLN